MHFTIRNAIAWQRHAIQRTRRYLARARSEEQRLTYRNDLRRYEGNIAALEGRANG